MGDARGQLWAGRRVPSPAPGVPWDAIAPHCHPDVPLGHIPEQASDKVTGDIDRSGVSLEGGVGRSPTSLVLRDPFPPLAPTFAPRSAGEDLLAAGAAEGPHHPGAGAAEAEPGPAEPGTSRDPHWDPPPGRVLLHHPPSSPPSLAPAHPCSSLPSSGQVLGRKDPPSAAPRRLPDVPGVGGLGTAGPPG